jgi:hypothetical protein
MEFMSPDTVIRKHGMHKCEPENDFPHVDPNNIDFGIKFFAYCVDDYSEMNLQGEISEGTWESATIRIDPCRDDND